MSKNILYCSSELKFINKITKKLLRFVDYSEDLILVDQMSQIKKLEGYFS